MLREHCLCPERIVLETGTMSGWLARGLGELGLPVEMIDARHAHAVRKLQHNQTDAGDAELLAELARSGFYRAVAVKSKAAREARVLPKARGHLVGPISAPRRMQSAGFWGPWACAFPRGRASWPGGSAPLLSSVATLKREIERLDQEVMARARAAPACRLLMSAPGIGSVTALAYVATIDDPTWFAKSRGGPIWG